MKYSALLSFVLCLCSGLAGQDVVAWAWVNPAGQGASFTPSLAFQHTPNGGVITVTRDPAQQNRFTVKFPGMAPATGVVHASASGSLHTVVVNMWNELLGDVYATVELFGPTGAPANNAQFLILYRRDGNSADRQAYLWADQPSSPSYTPSTTYSWNGNRPDPMITRLGTGFYEVRLPDLAPLGFEQGHVQLTPYANSFLRTRILSWGQSGADTLVSVECTDASGTATDGRFVLSYNETAAPISAGQGSGAHVWANNPSAASYTPFPAYTDSNGVSGPANAETIERVSAGRYWVYLPNVPPNGTAQLTPYGQSTAAVSLMSQQPDGCVGTKLLVNTYDAASNVADGRFTLIYLTNRPAVDRTVAWAFVDPTVPGATFTPDLAYQHNPGGAAITVDRDPVLQNRFTVRVPDLGLPGQLPHNPNDVVHVSAYGGNHTAVVRGWSFTGYDLSVSVELYDSGGGPANNGPFTFHYRHGGSHYDREAYVWASQSSTASYTAAYAWNANRPAPTITRTGPGLYQVRLPDLATSGPERGHVQVTPFGNQMRRAKVAAWGNSGADVVVHVRVQNAAGSPVDGIFVLSYNEVAAPVPTRSGSGAHVWANNPTSASYTPDPAYTDSNGTLGPPNAEAIDRLGIGYYRVNLPNLTPISSGTAQVTAYGASSTYAAVDYWSTNGAGGTAVFVRTYDAAGVAADARFTLLYLTDVSAIGTQALSFQFGTGCNGPVLSSLTRPILCRDWQLDLTGVPAGAVLGFLQLDVVGANNPLGAGAPGCTQYTGGAVTILYATPVPSPIYSLPIPSHPSFIGLPLTAQGGAFEPGLNPFWLAASNAVVGVVGDL